MIYIYVTSVDNRENGSIYYVDRDGHCPEHTHTHTHTHIHT